MEPRRVGPPKPAAAAGPTTPWLAPAAERVKRVVEAAATEPPSFVLARLLDRVLLPRLPDDRAPGPGGSHRRGRRPGSGPARAAAARRARPGRPAAQPVRALRIVAPARVTGGCCSGDDDADRLFLKRALVMEGDTEMGLVLKNTLDAIGPLLGPQPQPGPVRPALRRTVWRSCPPDRGAGWGLTRARGWTEASQIHDRGACLA